MMSKSIVEPPLHEIDGDFAAGQVRLTPVKVSPVFVFALVLAVGVLCMTASAEIIIEVIPASSYDADEAIMDANLGMPSDMSIEDFEDNVLVPFLEIDVGGKGVTRDNTHGNVAWDGGFALWNGGTGHNVMFSFHGGTTRVGIGISHLQGPDETILVNGIERVADIRSLPNFGEGEVRNGYVWIVATDSDIITTVTIKQPEAQQDTVFFDHLAFAIPAIPAVSTWGMMFLLLGVTTAGTVAVRRRTLAS